MIYFKLGRLASTFFDSISGVNINGKEVVALKKEPKNRKFQDALRGNHITYATEAEYIKAGGNKEIASEESATENEYLVKAREAGFDEEDMAKIQEAVDAYESASGKAKQKRTLSDLEELFEDLNASYSS